MIQLPGESGFRTKRPGEAGEVWEPSGVAHPTRSAMVSNGKTFSEWNAFPEILDVFLLPQNGLQVLQTELQVRRSVVCSNCRNFPRLVGVHPVPGRLTGRNSVRRLRNHSQRRTASFRWRWPGSAICIEYSIRMRTNHGSGRVRYTLENGCQRVVGVVRGANSRRLCDRWSRLDIPRSCFDSQRKQGRERGRHLH